MHRGFSLLARLHRWVGAAWTILACGAGLGFLARDVLQLPPPFPALAWLGGAAVVILPLARERLGAQDGQDGQSSVEWTALLLCVSLVLGAAASLGLRVDGRSFGGFLAHRVACAVQGECRDGDRLLARAYGDRDAALVREYAPNLVYEPGERQLPVDWRRCRRRSCADAPDERGLDAHRSHSGERATVYTRVLRRGARTYLQYWLYFPDSNTSWAGSDKIWEAAWRAVGVNGLLAGAPAYPGFHRDDWEAYAVRLDPDGRAWARVTSHGGWQGCKYGECRHEWIARTGWTRVSRGSHAGHIPMRREPSGRRRATMPRHVTRAPVPARRWRLTPQLPGHHLDERTTTSEALRLIPLETLDRRSYRPNSDRIRPPWEKDAYRDPESDEA